MRDEVIEGLVERHRKQRSWSLRTIWQKSKTSPAISATLNRVLPAVRGNDNTGRAFPRSGAYTRSAAHLPETLPSTWMQVSTSAAVLRFVETRFNEERTTADILRSFGEVRNVTFTPMSLRSIFLAMAKTGRDSA